MSLNIHQRINAIQKEVSYVKKDAEVGFGSNSYTAVSHDAVLSKLREQFIEKEITVIPQQRDLGVTQKTGETAKGKDWILFRALYDIRYVCADNPSDFLTVSVEGHGEDINDKADGKALSYACKSANLKLLLLATGDNDEERMEHKNKTQSSNTVTDTQKFSAAIKACKSGEEVTRTSKAWADTIGKWSDDDKAEARKTVQHRKDEFNAGG
jgi:hypothetical protein